MVTCHRILGRLVDAWNIRFRNTLEDEAFLAGLHFAVAEL